MPSPTPYRDLNGVLDEFLTSVRVILAHNFCGAYLQGSFALGEADVHSDVDFIVVTNEELEDAQVEGLRELHQRLHGLEVEWARHLEGSYVPSHLLRRVDPDRTPFLYLDNGACELVRDSHCNTAVVRWTLREHGVVLAGPDPASLVEPVSGEQLGAEARAALAEYAAWAPEPTRTGGMSRWKQPYLVLTCCRILHTLQSGRVVSKQEAGNWALRTLGSEWARLIRQALADRPSPWLRVDQPADPDLAALTLAFVDHALARTET